MLPVIIIRMAYSPIIIAFTKSSIMIIFLLSNQSPNTPAIGESRSLGIISMESIDAKIAADPVTARTYKDRAN